MEKITVILKEDIINQAIDAGIDASQLVFPYGASCPEPDKVAECIQMHLQNRR